MLGVTQARLIGILRTEFESNPESFLTIKEIHKRYHEVHNDGKKLNYKTIATILSRLADQQKVEVLEVNNRLLYRFKNIEEEFTSNILKLFINAFGVANLTHLTKKTQNLSQEEIDLLLSTKD